MMFPILVSVQDMNAIVALFPLVKGAFDNTGSISGDDPVETLWA